MDTHHTEREIWNKRFTNTEQLINDAGDMRYFLGVAIKNSCEKIDKDSEMPNSGYSHPVDITTAIINRETTLVDYASDIHNHIDNKLETVWENLLERSASLLNDAANLENYKTDNTLGIQTTTHSGQHGDGAITLCNKTSLGFGDFLPGKRFAGGYVDGYSFVANDVDQKTLHVEAFANLFQTDYNLIVESYTKAGFGDEIPTLSEYNQYLLHQGQFDPAITDKGWKSFRRAILNATIVVPIIETISGKDVITGYELTSDERLGQGVTAAVGVFTLGLSIYGLAAKAGLGVLSAKEIVLYAAGSIALDMGITGVTSITGQLLEEVLPPEVAWLIAAGVGFTLSWKLGKWYDGKWDSYIDDIYTGIQAEVLSGVNSKILKSGDEFLLNYNADEMNDIIRAGKKLGMSNDEIIDFIFVGSRVKKPISATELAIQMNNYKNIISKRNFPYRFDSFEDYLDFKGDLDGLLDKYGINGEIRIQGSSVRTPDAKDVDIAVFMTREEFDELYENIVQGLKDRIRNPETAEKMIAEVTAQYETGRINSYYFDRIPGSTSFNTDLWDLNGHTNIGDNAFDLSVMVDDEEFDLFPYLVD